jgi:hypothetical protein
LHGFHRFLWSQGGRKTVERLILQANLSFGLAGKTVENGDKRSKNGGAKDFRLSAVVLRQGRKSFADGWTMQGIRYASLESADKV